jgi:S-adenosylmethionine synthetase
LISINNRPAKWRHKAYRLNLKRMGIRCGDTLRLTIACAMVDRHVADIDDYLNQKAELGRLARDMAAIHGFPPCEVDVNSADRPSSGSIYLTVTGTSAEAGDDGRVGLGNRVSGLITPCPP